jgi:hypothetical protein
MRVPFDRSVRLPAAGGRCRRRPARRVPPLAPAAEREFESLETEFKDLSFQGLE